MAAPPRIHALVVNYNAGAWLRRAVSALAAEPVPLHLTVYDNASSDGSMATLEGLESVERVDSERNLGFGSACNRALADSRCEVFLIVNPDCELEHGAAEALLSVLDAQPRAALVGALVLSTDGSVQRSARRRRPTPRRSMASVLGLTRLGAEGVEIRDRMPPEAVRAEAVSGAVMMIRAAAFREVGGFDPGYFLHCEDLDLFWRLEQAGWEIWFQPDARAVHAQGVSQRSRPVRSEWHKHRGMHRYYRRHLAAGVPWPLRWVWPVLIWARFAAFAPVWWLRRPPAP